MATHSSTLAWKIPWTEEPGRLQSMGSRRVGHDWATSLSLFTFMHQRRKWQPTPVFSPGDPRDRGAWWAAVYGVTQSRTWLKWLSSSSSCDLSSHRGLFFSNFNHLNLGLQLWSLKLPTLKHPHLRQTEVLPLGLFWSVTHFSTDSFSDCCLFLPVSMFTRWARFQC